MSLTTGQVIDYKCLSKSCETCKSWEQRTNTPKYDKCARQHIGECKSHFNGSLGVIQMFGYCVGVNLTIEGMH